MAQAAVYSSSVTLIAQSILGFLYNEGPKPEREVRRHLAREGLVNLGPQGDTKFQVAVERLQQKGWIRITSEGLFQITTSGQSTWKARISVKAAVVHRALSGVEEGIKAAGTIEETLEGQLAAVREIKTLLEKIADQLRECLDGH